MSDGSIDRPELALIGAISSTIDTPAVTRIIATVALAIELKTDNAVELTCAWLRGAEADAVNADQRMLLAALEAASADYIDAVAKLAVAAEIEDRVGWGEPLVWWVLNLAAGIDAADWLLGANGDPADAGGDA